MAFMQFLSGIYLVMLAQLLLALTFDDDSVEWMLATNKMTSFAISEHWYEKLGRI